MLKRGKVAQSNSWRTTARGQPLALLPSTLTYCMYQTFFLAVGLLVCAKKVRHFGEIRRNSKVPYEEMIFFDDWDQNCKDVGKLGVTCVECRRVRITGSTGGTGLILEFRVLVSHVLSEGGFKILELGESKPYILEKNLNFMIAIRWRSVRERVKGSLFRSWSRALLGHM